MTNCISLLSRTTEYSAQRLLFAQMLQRNAITIAKMDYIVIFRPGYQSIPSLDAEGILTHSIYQGSGLLSSPLEQVRARRCLTGGRAKNAWCGTVRKCSRLVQIGASLSCPLPYQSATIPSCGVHVGTQSTFEDPMTACYGLTSH
jgi:hypothetical protein